MPFLGTHYGGWYVPDDMNLTKDSFVVSAGVGEDISFDLALQSATGCEILLLDPTERAIKHLKEVTSYYTTRIPFTGNIQPDYYQQIASLTPDLTKLTSLPIGLWSHEETLKFYSQSNPSYVSQTLIPGLYSSSYTRVPVNRLSALISRTPDILKLDIEGAEIAVLESLFEDNLFPRLLCIEFDLFLKGGDREGKTHALIERLMRKGYRLLYSNNYNMVFQLS